jgi:hypothetical protein
MTLNELVRHQVRAEGPDLEHDEFYEDRVAQYVDEQLNSMTNVELLERISDALALVLP